MPKIQKGNILVVGSIGIDTIFSVHGSIKEKIQIKKGKVLKQNMMFVGNEKKEFFGGTAGNIAYGLGVLEQKPMVFSVAGKDFPTSYGVHLKKYGVQSRIIVEPKHWTATFYGITDNLSDQIGIWQPNAYENFERTSLCDACSKKDLTETTIAIFSPGTARSTFKHMIELRKASPNATIIFDPGQMIMTYSKRLFLTCLALSDIVITNEVEYSQASKVLGKDLKKVCKEALKVCIITKGEKGSEIHSPDYKALIPAIPVKKVVDPTGAGDAFRAGLITRLMKGDTLPEACTYGSKVAAKSVAYEGPQNYAF